MIHESRLRHERAEAARTTAAAAYAKAGKVLFLLNPNAIHAVAADSDDSRPKRAVSEAMDELEFVSALGWTAEVRDTAQMLLSQIDRLDYTAWTCVGAIRSGSSQLKDAMIRLDSQVGDTGAAQAAFREALSH